MPDEIKYRIHLGSVEPKVERRFEGGRMVSYSYAIHRDMGGKETHRTEPTALGSIGYDDGTPFTEADYNVLNKIGEKNESTKH